MDIMMFFRFEFVVLVLFLLIPFLLDDHEDEDKSKKDKKNSKSYDNLILFDDDYHSHDLHDCDNSFDCSDD